jgi:hypothetical protein
MTIIRMQIPFIVITNERSECGYPPKRIDLYGVSGFPNLRRGFGPAGTSVYDLLRMTIIRMQIPFIVITNERSECGYPPKRIDLYGVSGFLRRSTTSSE